MKHSALLSFVVAALLAVAVVADAQPTKKFYRIGYLAPNSVNNSFRQLLLELGYIEKQNLVIEPRLTKDRRALQPELAAELVRLNVDLSRYCYGPA